MNPDCDVCLEEDAENVLCTHCMEEAASNHRDAGFNDGWSTAVKTIETWLREVAADPRLAHASDQHDF